MKSPEIPRNALKSLEFHWDPRNILEIPRITLNYLRLPRIFDYIEYLKLIWNPLNYHELPWITMKSFEMPWNPTLIFLEIPWIIFNHFIPLEMLIYLCVKSINTQWNPMKSPKSINPMQSHILELPWVTLNYLIVL